jgi:hypothetical protein
MKNVLIFVLAAMLCISLSACVRNKVEVREDLDFDTCLSELEGRMATEYGLENFRLTRFKVDHTEGRRDKRVLLVGGTYDNGGVRDTWGKYFSISHDDFVLLYRVNDDFIVYNTELTDYYATLASEIPAWAIKGVYNIMFK